MTVQELIDKLSFIENKDLEIFAYLTEDVDIECINIIDSIDTDPGNRVELNIFPYK